ncbi:hypothetical protein [Rubrivirga sp. IMCC43871]|uniref:hypothetical protein n=1 Tax=Rubrivirga sp. IMCC43871 TaxID=3391575 RepID=UPI00398F9808
MRALSAVLLLLLATATAAQPAIDYARLLNTRFFPETGQFLFGQSNWSPEGDDVLIFPPDDIDGVSGYYLVNDAEGVFIGGHRLGTVTLTESSVFATMGTFASSRWDGALEDGGTYQLSVVVNDLVVGLVPFTVAVAESGDPFEPGTTHTLEGPWRTHAYFQHKTDRPDYHMHLNAWVGPGELPEDGPIEVSIQRGGDEVAFGHGRANTSYGWGPVEMRLLKAESRDPERRFGRSAVNPFNWTIEDVTPGPYQVVFSGETGPFRTMTIDGAAGAFVPHARSALDYQPRGLYLTPRRMRGDHFDDAYSVYWIAPEE